MYLAGTFGAIFYVLAQTGQFSFLSQSVWTSAQLLFVLDL